MTVKTDVNFKITGKLLVQEDVNFKITGPCLSFLLRDSECSSSDQVGFLVGEKSSIDVQTVSDEEMEGKRIETTITINGTFPIGLPLVFCSPLGRIDEKTLKEILGDCQKDVLGWYSFRRNSNHSLSLRESLLHRELYKFLQHIPPEYFLFCIITSTECDRQATHSLRYTFHTYRKAQRRFQPVSVAEINLGEPGDNLYRKCTTVDDSYNHVKQLFSTLNTLNDSKETMTVLGKEVNRHVEELVDNVSRLQDMVDHQIETISSASFKCEDVENQTCSLGNASLSSDPRKEKLKEVSPEY